MADGMGRPLGSGYLLDSLIGQGAMGQVWRARSRDGQPFAIKVLRSDLTADPTFVARFLQEAQILKRVAGPNLVSVRDLVAEGTTLGIVMDLVNGSDLRKDMNNRGTVPARDAAWLIDQVLAGLANVHAAGIVHRDIKPENVLMDQTGAGLVPRITDFGIARIVEQGPASRTTAIMGTPEYMAPELAEGEPPSPQSDLYSVGIMLYELLCGVTPFAGGSPLAVLRKHVAHEAGRPAGIPDPLWGFINHLIAKNPAARPRSADEARQLLASVAPAVVGVGPLPRLQAPPEPRITARETVVAPVLVNEAPTVPVPKKKRRSWVLVPLVLLLVAAIGVGAFLALRPGGPLAPAALQGTPGAQTTTPGPTPTVTTPSPTVTTPSTAPSVVVTGASPGAIPATVAATVPTVTGMQFGPATSILQKAGYSVTLNEIIDETKPDGTVLQQDPAGGATPTSSNVILSIARHSVTAYLADWDVVQSDNGRPDAGTVTINGKTYTHGMWSRVGRYESHAKSWQYALGRGYRKVAGVVGLGDDSNSSAVVRYEFLVDGRQVKTLDTGLGVTNPVEIDVSGGLRLEVRVTCIAGIAGACNAAFGDLTITGIPGEVPTATPTKP